MVFMKHVFKGNLSASDVRHFCIQCGLFTCGDNEQYGNMLNKCGIIDADGLFAIAEDIYQFSDWETLHDMYSPLIPDDMDCLDEAYIEAITRDLLRYIQFFVGSRWVNEEGKELD